MSLTISQVSAGLAAVVRAVSPAVVRVEARRRGPASGVVWDARAGLVVTTAHAIEREEDIAIGLPDGTRVSASLVGRDPSTDVALLKIDGAHGLHGVTWSDAPALQVGHLALVLARPGRTTRATHGIVSALAPDWRGPAGGRFDRYLELDTGLVPGFSGGPVADVDANVFGIATAGVVRGSTLVIPTPTVRRVVDRLKERGTARRGYLGIGAHPVKLPEELARKAGGDAGLLVFSVDARGPASGAGLMLGDVVTALDGQSVSDMQDLFAWLAEDKVGTTATLRMLRAGEVLERTITIGERG